tara:strand:- start:515 stop:649 length:135 start_codon:yes stop_codon:yes gene_type:complete
MAALSRKHAMEMIQKGNKPHQDAMRAMVELMNDPASIEQWMFEI